MTEDRLPLSELLQKSGEGDFLRAVAESVLQLLMEADVEGVVGAGRSSQRYGHSPSSGRSRKARTLSSISLHNLETWLFEMPASPIA